MLTRIVFSPSRPVRLHHIQLVCGAAELLLLPLMLPLMLPSGSLLIDCLRALVPSGISSILLVSNGSRENDGINTPSCLTLTAIEVTLGSRLGDQRTSTLEAVAFIKTGVRTGVFGGGGGAHVML
jgi:hypothetical protein